MQHPDSLVCLVQVWSSVVGQLFDFLNHLMFWGFPLTLSKNQWFSQNKLTMKELAVL
jgi:hypothetical protein